VRSLRGHLLVAGPALDDPNFRRAVVLIGEHDAEGGAMGVVLNRPSDTTVDDAVPPMAELAAPGAHVHVGGPVEPQVVVVLADFADPTRAEALVVGNVGFLPGEVEPGDLGELRDVRVYAGYAGWAPGQLETELGTGSWIILRAHAADVFTTTPDTLWRDVLRREGGPLAVLALLPDDPRVN
jgi:putative transcriptional regulator